jgi:Zn-dependent protease with chaperone function
MNLVYKHEKALFAIAALLSGIFWTVLVVGTLGLFLIYLLIGYVVFLFAHSAFISHLKGTGVRISETQFPDLYETLKQSCAKIGLKDIPEAYVLRTGFFNALATKFLGKHFVVLFSDVVDALQDQTSAIDFYIGHELGHIHRKHLAWKLFVAPASILPLLGAALRRAEEYTCDRYGVACCQSAVDIKAAIAAIAVGDTRWKSIDIKTYLDQVAFTSGFWMSFNELIADYPWLTKRMATALALKEGKEIDHPGRHWFAWILSVFVPRLGAGGAAGSMIIIVAMIGILAAVAIPAYQDFTERARFANVYTESLEVQHKVDAYMAQTGELPTSMQSLGYENDTLVLENHQAEIGLYDDGVIGAKIGMTKEGNDRYIVLKPELGEAGLSWSCYGDNIESNLLPPACR